MFLDEARLAARIRHPNVVPTLDVVAPRASSSSSWSTSQGESLAPLVRDARDRRARRSRSPIALGDRRRARSTASTPRTRRRASAASRSASSTATSRRRTSSSAPTACARVLDFGVAKAAGRAPDDARRAAQGQARVHGARAAPRRGRRPAHRRLRGRRRPLGGAHRAAALPRRERGRGSCSRCSCASPSRRASSPRSCPAELDAVVMRGLARDPAERFATAREMALELEEALRACARLGGRRVGRRPRARDARAPREARRGDRSRQGRDRHGRRRRARSRPPSRTASWKATVSQKSIASVTGPAPRTAQARPLSHHRDRRGDRRRARRARLDDPPRHEREPLHRRRGRRFARAIGYERPVGSTGRRARPSRDGGGCAVRIAVGVVPGARPERLRLRPAAAA